MVVTDARRPESVRRMVIELQWRVTRSEDGHPREFYAQLPSGAIAFARWSHDIWIGIVQLRGKPDQAATFGSAHDAKTAIAADEVRRLIELGIQAAAVDRHRPVALSISETTTSNLFDTTRAEAG